MVCLFCDWWAIQLFKMMFPPNAATYDSYQHLSHRVTFLLWTVSLVWFTLTTEFRHFLHSDTLANLSLIIAMWTVKWHVLYGNIWLTVYTMTAGLPSALNIVLGEEIFSLCLSNDVHSSSLFALVIWDIFLMFYLQPNGFNIEITNTNPNVVMVGVRILIGCQSVEKAPSFVEIFGRVIQLSLTRNRWFDLPFTREESLSADKKFSLFSMLLYSV